jgi:hypothetical protein
VGYIVVFTKVLYQIYSTWIYPFHHLPLSSPSPVLGIVSTGVIFLFMYMCTQCLNYIPPLSSFPHLFPPLTVTRTSSGRINFFPPDLQFCIRKEEVGYPWFQPVILAIQKIRKTMDRNQPGQIVRQTLSRKRTITKRAARVAQGVGPEFKPQYRKN